MGRKNKKVIARILAVLMAFTLLPFDLWGSANVVMAEEFSKVYLAEESELNEEGMQEKQEEVDEKETLVGVDDAEGTAPIDEDKKTEGDKNKETAQDKKGIENDSTEADIKAVTATGIHYHNFTESMTLSDDYFKISPITEASNVSKTTYIDKSGQTLTLTKAIDVSNSNKVTISFNAETSGTLVLVTQTGKKWNVTKPGDSKSTGILANDVGVLEVQSSQAGNWELSKNNNTVLYYVAFIPEGSEPVKQTVATPTANPANGEITVDSKIQLSCDTDNATIHYTTDGSDPRESERTSTHIGDTEITVTSSMVIDNKVTIRAYATKEGCTDSECASFEYTVTKAVDQLAEPVATPDPKDGAVARGTKVALESNEDGASIYYTTDGTDPSVSSEMLYRDPIEITEEMTIKAIAAKENFTTSFPASFTYTIKKPTIKVNDDNFSKSVISKVELNGDVIFTNGTKEVFDISLKTVENTNPDNNVKAIAEGLKENDGEIIYYDFSLVNNESTSDTVSIADNSDGTIKIEIPYSIMPNVGKRNGIVVVNATTGEIATNKDSSGFIFDADSVGSYAVVINPAGAVDNIVITESAGYEEGAYAEWEAIEGADGYMAYVAPQGGEYTRIDDELIRQYEDYWRVDTVGLTKGTYYIKINAVVLGMENGKETATVISSNITKPLRVTNYDRSGFAFSDKSPLGTASGAYNDDGTLKEGAQVIYVTAKTAKTCTATVNGTTVTGFQAILDAKQKRGTSNDILDIRIIGCINEEDLDSISSSEEGIQIKGVAERTPMNITLEGIGEDAAVKGFGFLVRNCGNVEIRNFGVLYFMDDGISVDTDNCNLWIHDMDLFYGKPGSDSDQKKGDGSVDIKKSQYCTVSYNHFWDSGKCCLIDATAASSGYADYLTYHHNWFDHSDSRHPRIRNGKNFHIYNNYYDGNSKYGVGATSGSSAFVEANYFRNCKYPMMIAKQGTDALGAGTFSKDSGGMIKAYANYMEGEQSYLPYSSTNTTEFDAYEVTDASIIVPSSVTTKAGSAYNNFDTSDEMYNYVADTPQEAKEKIVKYAGRLNGGDLKWTFGESEDTNYDVIPELKSLVENYKTTVTSISGGVKGNPTVIDDDMTPPGSGDDNFQTISAPKASIPTNREVEKGTKITLTSDIVEAEIYYTLNGGTPTKNSIRYANAIEITGTTTIRAIAYVGSDYSDVSIFKYTVPGSSEPGPEPNPGGDDQPANTKIETYEFNPEGLKMEVGMTIPEADTKYGTKDYFIFGNSDNKAKIAATSTSGKTTKAPVPSKSEVQEYSVRYQFGAPVLTASDAKAIKFTTKNKARVSVAAYHTSKTATRKVYLDSDETNKTLTNTVAEYTFDIVEAGTHGIYAKDGDICIFYVIVEEFVPITIEPGDNTEVKVPYSMVSEGEVPKGTPVELKCDTTDAKIYYTTDGTDPEVRDELLYKDTIVINETVTIKAIAAKGENKSSVVSFKYTVSTGTSGGDTQNVAAPKATPGDGAQFPSAGGSVELVCDTDGATIYYTMSSTENGLTDPADDKNTERIEYNHIPILIKEETYIWAVAVKNGVVSEALKSHYVVLAEGAVVHPTATPGSSAVTSGTKVALSTTEPVDNIYYTMGSTPAATADPTLENSGRIVYDAKTQIVITEAVTIKAVAQKGGKYSDVATFTYTVVSGGTENPGDPEVKTIKLEECEITVPAIIRNMSKKADANQPSVTYVTYKYTDGSGEEKHVKFAEGEYLDYKVVWNGAVEGKENTYSVTLTGLGREEDQFKIDTASTITKEYKVIDKPGKDSTVKVIDISKAKVNLAATDIKNVVYTGYAIEPKLDYSKDKDNLTGKLNIAYKNNVNAGKATVIISAKPELNDENTIYIGSKTLTFNIKKAALNKDNAKATAKVSWDDSFSMTSGHEYAGTPVIVKGLKVESGKGRILRLDTDYTVTYKNNARAGKATVTVKGIGNNLSGSWTQNFTINPVDLKTLTFSVKELPYSPKGAKLAAITAENAAGDVYTLKEGVDYTAKYTYASKTKEAGSRVTVSISGKGACTGKDIEIGELEIAKGDFAKYITVPEDIAVDGKDLAKELAKAIVVTDASGVKLVVNKDYTIGTPDKAAKTVTINPVDTKNYENVCSVPYRVAINLAKDKGFVFDKNKEKNAPLAYDGRNPVMLTADIINEYVGSAYQLGKNIEIVPGTYKNNTKKGTAQVTVRGKAGVDAGFYGQKVLKFKIVEK